MRRLLDSIFNIKVFVFLTLLVGAVLVIWFWGIRPAKQEKVVETLILQEAQDEQFLVLGSRVVDITVTKSESTDTFFEKILVGKKIRVRAPVKVYYGIDLNADNIQKAVRYDYALNCVVIDTNVLGKPGVLDSVVIYPIEFETQKGILRVFEEDTEENINELIPYLKRKASEQVSKQLSSDKMQDSMRENLINLIKFNLKDVSVCIR